MKRKFNSLADLLEDVQVEVEVIAEENILPRGMEVLYLAIWKKVYSKPSQYNRTFEFLNSVSGDVERLTANKIRVNITTDYESMDDPHESWITGKNQRKHIAKWLDKGHKGLVSYKAANFFAVALTQFSRRAPIELNKALKGNGIRTVKRK